ncbi:BtrH N-terminal domain-containing protein [Jidongwangia harbinensis]|uniref:BtrH N-terminal domain-containing protein n=1 Tax=Jidongwangia harbinensis TaxID=2878561 RepID=UPI001CD9D141|nr:BtrH N-terminal domain-containing protein [Jidongwangia harbinensis]MCA2218358.1 BtrH N-terminal domain-containing protein [Jidongwangia harbinensis]
MTEQKHLKARIRARMARTGERYAAARRHVVGDAERPASDSGWTLRGGLHPETAAVAHLLADRGVELSEAMVLGLGGGLGAGYILWEFAAHDTTHLTLGFRNRWNYLDWTDRTLDRLGVRYRVHTTAGAKGAAAELAAVLAAGERALVVPDRYLVGYWHLPAHLEAHGGHPVVAYAATGAGVRIDDRNTRPLTVAADALDRARARVSSYRNRLVVVADASPPEKLADLVRAAVRDGADHLGGTSASFALPAWRKWARLCTDRRNAKGWPTVFADGRGLATALLTVWEAVEPVGMSGGHLRDLYAEFLDEVTPLLGERAAAAAEAFRAAGRRWHAFAEAALPADVPEYARLRELTAAVAAGVALGDDGAAARAEAAGELWRRRAELDRRPPVAPDFGVLAEHLFAVHAAEQEAVALLRTVPQVK